MGIAKNVDDQPVRLQRKKYDIVLMEDSNDLRLFIRMSCQDILMCMWLIMEKMDYHW